MLGSIFSFHSVVLHKASQISCLIFQFVMQFKYVLWFLVVDVKDVDSTVHKVDAIHDPMQFEHDGDPNLQKNVNVTT
jgi:hypothetical protein